MAEKKKRKKRKRRPRKKKKKKVDEEFLFEGDQEEEDGIGSSGDSSKSVEHDLIPVQQTEPADKEEYIDNLTENDKNLCRDILKYADKAFDSRNMGVQEIDEFFRKPGVRAFLERTARTQSLMAAHMESIQWQGMQNMAPLVNPSIALLAKSIRPPRPSDPNYDPEEDPPTMAQVDVAKFVLNAVGVNAKSLQAGGGGALLLQQSLSKRLGRDVDASHISKEKRNKLRDSIEILLDLLNVNYREEIVVTREPEDEDKDGQR